MQDVNITPTFDSDGDNSAQALLPHPGRLYFVNAYNSNGAAAFIQIFDATSANVTVGTTTPKMSLFVPAGGAYSQNLPVNGFHFNTAITYACTTTATGSGDPTTGLTLTLGAK